MLANSNKHKHKAAEIIRLSLYIPVHLFKKILEKSKFFDKEKKPIAIVKMNIRQLYAQVASPKITDILKLKEDYLNLPAKKIENIHRIINNAGKPKSCIKMTTKGLLQKQIIVTMGKDNINKFIALSSVYIANLNRSFKNIKSDIMAYYI